MELALAWLAVMLMTLGKLVRLTFSGKRIVHGAGRIKGVKAGTVFCVKPSYSHYYS